MRNSLLQMSDCNQHCTLLAVRDLHQNQLPSLKVWLKALVQATKWDRPHCWSQIWICHCVFGFWGDPCYICSIKVTMGWMVFWFPPNHGNGEQHWRDIYPSCEKPHTRSTTNMSGPTVIFVTHFTPKMKLTTFLIEWGEISTLRLEGQFTTHVAEGVRMIWTLPRHDEIIINPILLHKTLQYKEHRALATYHSAVRHTNSSAVFLNRNLLIVSCRNVSEHVWAFAVWLSVIGLRCLLCLLRLPFHARPVYKICDKVHQPYLKPSPETTSILAIENRMGELHWKYLLHVSNAIDTKVTKCLRRDL